MLGARGFLLPPPQHRSLSLLPPPSSPGGLCQPARASDTVDESEALATMSIVGCQSTAVMHPWWGVGMVCMDQTPLFLRGIGSSELFEVSTAEAQSWLTAKWWRS
mmetsp:Transcript_31287/g.88715  ORF Transcript_31287/g.88715 Transcript_31287/m.88715 type:complete len:105 (+) Transcript_31287:297-611(+)